MDDDESGKSEVSLKDIHHKNLSNPFMILIGSISIFFVTQIISSSLVLPLKKFINNDILLSAVYVCISGLVLVLILTTLKKIVNFKWSTVGWSRPNRKAILTILPALFLYIFVSMALTGLAVKFFPKFNVQQAQEVGFDQLRAPIEFFLAFVALSVLTPIIEETIFRGILYKGLRKNLPFWASTVVTSLVFAVAHLQWNVAVDTFALSLILCYLVEKSDSIIPSIFLHALKNSLAFIFLFLYK